jgi:hypothetical protein
VTFALTSEGTSESQTSMIFDSVPIRRSASTGVVLLAATVGAVALHPLLATEAGAVSSRFCGTKLLDRDHGIIEKLKHQLMRFRIEDVSHLVEGL